MARRTRKQLVLEDEELARRDREEGYRRLEIELRRLWYQADACGAYPHDSSLMLPFHAADAFALSVL
jgi:hypothetical protein